MTVVPAVNVEMPARNSGYDCDLVNVPVFVNPDTGDEYVIYGTGLAATDSYDNHPAKFEEVVNKSASSFFGFVDTGRRVTFGPDHMFTADYVVANPNVIEALMTGFTHFFATKVGHVEGYKLPE